MCTKQAIGIGNQNPEMNEVLQSGRISCNDFSMYLRFRFLEGRGKEDRKMRLV